MSTNNYRASISEDSVHVLFAFKQDGQVKGMFHKYSTFDFQKPLEEKIFDSMVEANQYFEDQGITHEITGSAIRGIFGDFFAVQQLASEYQFSEDPAQYLKSIERKQALLESVPRIAKFMPFSPNVQELSTAVESFLNNRAIEVYPVWPALNACNAALAFVHIDGLGERLVLVDVDDRADKKKLAEIEIKPVPWTPKHAKGIYFLDNDKRTFNLSALGKAFGLDPCPIDRNLPKTQAMSAFFINYQLKTQKNWRQVMENSRTLGVNQFGQPVSEYEGTRYLKTIYGHLTEHDSNNHGAFLLAINPNGEIDVPSLKNCLLPVAKKILSGERVSAKQLESAGQIFFRQPDLSEKEIFQLQEKLETVIYESYGLLSDTTKSDLEQFNLAKTVYFNQPKRNLRRADTIALGQYSTPLPMAVVAQQILLATTAKNPQTVLEPTIGNGGLVSIVSRSSAFQVKGVELDRDRINDSINAEITIGDSTNIDLTIINGGYPFDAVIANPPFGELPEKLYYDGEILIQRLDYLIALKALAARKDEGKAIFILGSDGHFSQGELRGGSKYFYNYIFNNYQVDGLIELDSSLYQRNGANTNVRMLVIGNRREVPGTSNQHTAPDKISVIKNYDDLFAWGQSTIRNTRDQVFSFVDIGLDHSIMPLTESGTNQAVNTVSDVFDFGKNAPEQNTRQFGPQSLIITKPDSDVLSKKVESAAFVAEVRRKGNELQAPYVSASNINEATAMIPINLASSTAAAFERIKEKYPDVDQYVCDRLQYESKEKLGSLFSAEQIDALAMAIFSHEESGRAMINADQTGMGKGRYMAGLMRYSRLKGMTPVFITYKPSLMSDIFRDIANIESMPLLSNAFILNNEKISNFFDPSKPLFKKMKIGEHKEIITGSLPEDIDLVLATYSQFSMKYARSAKTKFMERLAQERDIFLLLDESHVASGASNINENITCILDVAKGASFSSATALKTTKSFSLYKSIFPPSINIELLPEILTAGGEGLQEAVSNCLAADGALICRQHDLSNLEIRTIEATEEQTATNRAVSDQVAEILTLMSTLSGDINNHVSQMNDEFKSQYDALPDEIKKLNNGRMQASSMNFGSRLYNITRQFLMGIQVEQAAQQAIHDLDNNIKPVIGVENTGESFLHSLINAKLFSKEEFFRYEELSDIPKKDLTQEQEEELNKLSEKRLQGLEELSFDEAPQFKDYLAMMLDRLRTVYVKNAYGVGSFQTINNPSYEAIEETILAAIDKLPNTIPLMPLDVIRTKLEQQGYSLGEVSGRKIFLKQEANPKGGDLPPVWKVQAHPEKEVTKTINEFQDGKKDAIIITRAGSTGFSMHADPVFKDTRQRDFIALQKAANIADFLQWIGRVNRKGQVLPPIISGLGSGLPAELRLTMMHNAKLRKLSANITSNRENNNIENQEVDFLNKVGDELALNLLLVQPVLAEQLNITLPSDSEDVPPPSENYYINRLMSRLVLLPVDTQESIISQLSVMFSEKIEELNAKGINPFKVDIFDWKASKAQTFEISSYTGLDTNSYFDAPLQVSTLEFEVQKTPLEIDEIEAMIGKYLDEHASGQEFNDFLLVSNSPLLGPSNIRQAKLTAMATKINKQLLERCFNQLPSAMREQVGHSQNLHTYVQEWEQDLKFEKQLEVYRQAKTAERFHHYSIGAYLYTINHLGEIKPARVVGYIFPEKGLSIAHMARTGIQVVIAGDDRISKLNLAKLHSQRLELEERGYSPYLNADEGKILFESEITDSMNSRFVKSVQVLENNLFKATEMAVENKMGHPILYTDQDGIRQRAILLKPEFTFEALKKLPIKLSTETMLDYLKKYYTENRKGTPLQEGNPIFHSRMTKHSKIGLDIGITALNEDRYQFIVFQPKSAQGKQLLKDDSIFASAKNQGGGMGLKMVGRSDYLQCEISHRQLQELLNILNDNHKFGGFYVVNGEESILHMINPRKSHEQNFSHNPLP